VRVCLTAAAVLVAGSAAPARADVQDWEVNEVLTSRDGDPGIRFIELKNDAGGCLFPTSRVDVRRADGTLAGSVALVTTTTCFEAGWHLWIASTGAVAAYGIPADRQLVAALDPAAGQVCFASSATRYDCVRWGVIADPLTDFFGPVDTTSAVNPADGASLSRTSTTHVVAGDWELLSPTPRAPNDGTPWTPPDAGPIADAGPIPDAAAADATPPADAVPLTDAAPPPDARNDDYLDASPVGGATCSCRTATPGGGWPLALALAIILWRRRSPAATPARRAGPARRTGPPRS
jgi:MYXO-CTERM domain-containing protein